VMYRFKAIEDPNNKFLEMILQELGCPAALLPIVMTPAADCTVFAHLATLLYIPPNNYAKETIRDGYPELFNYCSRIHDTVFGKQFAKE
ncbi:hypothetical protein GCK32_021345, partial [Trichostrongylus colubriformis]